MFVGCNCLAVFPLFASEVQHRAGEVACYVGKRGFEEPGKFIVLPSSLQVEGESREAVGIGHSHGGHGCAQILGGGPEVGPSG